MADIWRVVRWWDDWELRILVLGSLGLQWFLLLAAPMRKFSIPRIFRTCIWLAYISSDALAIYGLATLFNRHARASSNLQQQPSSILEVLWSPILLIHLGGQKEMTGYAIEDSELWTRHAVTLVSQVAVALYAFCKSWHSPSDWKLLAVAVLLFVVGVASLSVKPFAFNRAKTKRLAVAQRTRKHSKWAERISSFFLFEEGSCFGLSTQSSHSTANLVREEEEASGRMKRRGWCGNKERKRKPVDFSEDDKLLMVLSDMSLLATAYDLVARGEAQSVEEVLPPMPFAEKALPRSLGNALGVIFTRASVAVTPLYLVYHLLVVPILHIAALTLFARSDKHPYKRTDVKITYILLCLTATLDILAEFIRWLLYMLMSMIRVPALCETVPSYNIIDDALSKGDKSIGWIYRCATRLCSSFFCSPQHAQLDGNVIQTMIIDLVDAQDRDLASYRIFDTDNTNWALSNDLQQQCGVEIRKSLRAVSFDRSVLLWHIATDLCHRCSIDDVALVDDGGVEEDATVEPEQVGEGPEEQEQHMRERDPTLRLYRECTVAISNYMAHLLNVNPEMLLTGSRHHLISEALDEFNKYLLFSKKKKKDTLSKQDIELILDMEHKSVYDDIQVFNIKEACMLAKELLELQEDTRWKIMYRVWLGMLCYSASMCRGYLHTKSLSEGGEFLSFVWFMLVLKGAKSLADKHQMPPET